MSYPAAHGSPAQSQAATGAIFQGGYDVALFEDLKAHRIGDILTVRLSESNQAAKSNNNAVTKSGSSSSTIPPSSAPSLNSSCRACCRWRRSPTILETDLSSSNDYSGKADSKQSNSLNGSITVTVADVLPKGNLLIRGEKRLNLNQGNEYIKDLRHGAAGRCRHG